ncbi:MAG: CHAT domain-containing protein, partial [Pricia sp.]
RGKYDVVVFPFDWRRPLEQSAILLNAKIESLLKIGQPIKIIGHSMGGVLVRDFIIDHPNTWRQLNTSKDFKLIFLGAPLSGSHRILTVLFGHDGIIRKLGALDFIHTKKSLLKVFSRFPGILDLLPLVDERDDYADLEVWEKMRDAFGKPDWPLPTEADLERFADYRSKILKGRDDIDYSNMVYIAGKDKMTPYGYRTVTMKRYGAKQDDKKDKTELYFLYTGEGDQSVTWKLGIPKPMIEADSVYYTRISHGALANDPSIFSALDEILTKGHTRQLRKSKPMVRGEETVFRAEPDLDFDLSENGLVKTVLGLGQKTESVGSRIPISVTLSMGDLRYASYPILAGHFLNDGILHAEKAIDRYLNESLSSKLQLGLYPGEIGSNTIFDRMPHSDFAGAIIVGMGEPDRLTSFELTRSIELGVLNYLHSLRGHKVPDNGIGISSLVMANGYGGLSIESSMKATIMGVERANERIKLLTPDNYETVQRIEFVELYANRALNCMYTLNQIANRDNAAISITLGSKKIKKLLGARKRIPLDASEDWWNRITVKYKKVNKDTDELESMVFGASTSDSREEENEIYSSTPLINEFITEVSHDNQWSSCTAKTLFELLIPNALKERLKRKGHILLIVDTKTASYPWELLQDSAANAKPLCVNSGMIRQLSTGQYRTNIKRVADRNALIVADPILDNYIGQLPGAREEGQKVKELLNGSGCPVNALIGSDASAIVRELFCKDYSIIHLAGHGLFKPKSPKESGMVIGKELFLTVFEIQQMPVVPELVFVNCCHLGYSNDEEEQFYKNRYKLAANIGTELIQIGVKAVIAAGWAVNDSAALEFAEVFYDRMLSGYPFGEAVKMARAMVYEKYPETNTWGAYQCYGDPFFKLKDVSNGSSSLSYLLAEEAEIDLENLLNRLQMGTTTRKDALYHLEEIIETLSENKDFITGPILEREAKIYSELAIYDKAVEKYRDLLRIEKAKFSFSCMETYCNLRIKNYAREFFETATTDTAQKRSKNKAEAYKNVKKIIKDLDILLAVGETAQRHNLLGSAYKRLAMLASTSKSRLTAQKSAMESYLTAYEHPTNENTIYSLTNAIELIFLRKYAGPETSQILIKIKEDDGEQTYNLSAVSATKTHKSAKDLLEKHRTDLMNGKDTENLDYWNLASALNIDLCHLLMDYKNIRQAAWSELFDTFHILWQKAGSEGKKIAELEHLQFLIDSVNKVAGNKTDFSPIGSSNSKDKLETYIEELRAAFSQLQNRRKR